MINAQMREYTYFLYDSNNDYGQQVLIKDANGEPVPQGTVKMAINLTSQSIQDNINYTSANYLGLTHATVTDNFVIKYGDEMLKVLYVNPKGRYKQVFLGTI